MNVFVLETRFLSLGKASLLFTPLHLPVRTYVLHTRHYDTTKCPDFRGLLASPDLSLTSKRIHKNREHPVLCMSAPAQLDLCPGGHLHTQDRPGVGCAAWISLSWTSRSVPGKSFADGLLIGVGSCPALEGGKVKCSGLL